MMQNPSRRARSVRLAAVAACAASLLLASSASAGVILGVGPDIPTPNGPVTVGQTGIAASLTIVNSSTGSQKTFARTSILSESPSGTC